MAAAMLYVLLLVAPGAGAAARAPRARVHALVTLPTDLHVRGHGQQTTALLITPATSSSSSDSAPSGIDEHTAHCASGIVPNNHTIKTPAAHVDYATIVPVTRLPDITAHVFTSGSQPGAS